MSITLSPHHTLGFTRPLTRLVMQTLTMTNNNDLPVTYKVKTTAADIFCVRPNPGRVEPGETVQVSVIHEPMSTEPPETSKCPHKFLVLTTLIHDDKPLQEIWNAADADGRKVHRYKMRVRYLPAVRYHTLHEDEGESAAPAGSGMTPATAISVLEDESQDTEEYFLAHEDLHCPRPNSAHELDLGTHAFGNIIPSPQTDLEKLVIELNQAEAEIERLKGLLAGLAFPVSEARPTGPKAYRRWHSVRVAVPNALAITVVVFVVTYVLL